MFLTACGTVPGSDPPISQTQTLAQRLCGFVPTSASIIKLASTFFGFLSEAQLAEQIANSVCDAIKTRPLAEGPLVVRGVRVEGRFVRRK